jgi:hypothetical protein
MKIVSSNESAETSQIRATLRTENCDGTYSINGKGRFKRISMGEQIINDIDDDSTWTTEFIKQNSLDKLVKIF